MDYADTLFGVFQILHTEEELESTSIGLANVRRIIATQGSRTWGDGSVHYGETYCFTITMQKEFIKRGASFKNPALDAAEASSKDA
jgi:light-regulated signal transduction histidine kinase (bacteriophytochrome)